MLSTAHQSSDGLRTFGWTFAPRSVDNDPMFALPKIFHVSHVVDDLDGATAWYERVFGAHLWQRSELFGTSLALLVVGDAVMMPMQPPPGVKTAPGRFRERFGSHLHSLALYVEEPAALIEHLRSLGFRLTGSDGQELRDPRDEIWTQPAQTPMLFEFFEARASMGDPRLLDPDWSADYWVERQPLGIRRAWSTLVTDDGARASDFLVSALRGQVTHRAMVDAYGTASSFVVLSDEVVLEVAEVRHPGRAADDLAAGARFHAVTFEVSDFERALAHLDANGVRTEVAAPGHAVIDPADSFGALLRITDRRYLHW